jgi:hypothetical protein
METKMNDREYPSSRGELSRARDRGVALVLSLVVAAAGIPQHNRGDPDQPVPW